MCVCYYSDPHYLTLFLKFQQIHTDIIIVWRAWVLFPQQRWLMAGPIILLLALIGKV